MGSTVYQTSHISTHNTSPYLMRPICSCPGHYRLCDEAHFLRFLGFESFRSKY